MSAALRLRRHDAPVDRSFTDWGREVVGDERVVAQVASLIGVATFHHDPGSLSASFVAERLRRATKLPPAVRYITGGWGALADRLGDHARSIGVRIETSSPVDSLPEGGPVVLAVPLAEASELLGTPVSWTGTRTALLDVAISARRGDAFAVGDLEESGWAETFSMPDPTIAPRGEHLVQAQMGMRPGESLDDAIVRIERLLDAGFRDWRTRETWRRRARIEAETGAVDLPGTSWLDRPAVDRGDDVYLIGDMVAAPGLLAEVSHASSLTAVAAITKRAGHAARHRPVRTGDHS
jgi:phytoene dehydrogenase-like protein